MGFDIIYHRMLTIKCPECSTVFDVERKDVMHKGNIDADCPNNHTVRDNNAIISQRDFENNFDDEKFDQCVEFVKSWNSARKSYQESFKSVYGIDTYDITDDNLREQFHNDIATIYLSLLNVYGLRRIDIEDYEEISIARQDDQWEEKFDPTGQYHECNPDND